MKTPRLWIIITLPLLIIFVLCWFLAPPIPAYAVGDSVQLQTVCPDAPGASDSYVVTNRKIVWMAQGNMLRPGWTYQLRAADGYHYWTTSMTIDSPEK